VINLLPADTQRNHRAARLNLKLRTYVFILLLALVAILGIYGGGYYLTLQERAVAESELQAHQQDTAKYASVRQEAKTFADNLRTAKSILSQETLYSDLLVQIAQTLPSNAVLTTLTLDTTSFQAKPVVISGRVKTETDALILKSKLEESPLFEDVRLTNVSTAATSGTAGSIANEFPVSVSLSAKMSKKPTSGANR